MGRVATGRPVRAGAAICLTLLSLLATAQAAGAKTKLFRSSDKKVVCVAGRVGDLPRSVTCTSPFTLAQEPEPSQQCGSNMSAIELRTRRRARLVEICNPLYVPNAGLHIKTLRKGHRVGVKGFLCRAPSRRVIRCRSNASHHGFQVSRTGLKRF